MPIPDQDSVRVIYARNPLTSVICQLRFPAILLIDAESPAYFQEKVRAEFPEFHEVYDGTHVSLPDSIANIVPKELRDSLTSRGNKRYEFKTTNLNWSISLTKDFLALEVKQYYRWEEFREYLLLALDALIKIYEPAFFSRIGLRYQNVIDRDSLGLISTPWKDLMSGFILGPLGENTMMSSIVENHGSFSLRLNDEGDLVRVQHGLGSDTDDEDSKEKYFLDNDFFTSVKAPAEVAYVASKTDGFNSLNRRLFRSCIRDTLHDAMCPQTA